MGNPDNNVASDSSLDNSSQDEKNTEQLEAKDDINSNDVEEYEKKVKEILSIFDEENISQPKIKDDGSFENVEEQDEKLKEIYNIIDEACDSFKEACNNFERINKNFSNLIKESKEAKQNTTNSDEHDKNTDKDEETSIEPANKEDEFKKALHDGDILKFKKMIESCHEPEKILKNIIVEFIKEKKEELKEATTNLENIREGLSEINSAKPMEKLVKKLTDNMEIFKENEKKLSEKMEKLNSVKATISKEELLDTLSSITEDFCKMLEKDKGVKQELWQ